MEGEKMNWKEDFNRKEKSPFYGLFFWFKTKIFWLMKFIITFKKKN